MNMNVDVGNNSHSRSKNSDVGNFSQPRSKILMWEIIPTLFFFQAVTLEGDISGRDIGW